MQRIKQFLRNCLQVRILVPLLTTLVWSVSTLYAPANVVSGAFSLLFLPLMPGYVLYRVIAGYPRSELKSRALLYSVGLSLTSLMVIGLGLNQIMLALGQGQPLTVQNLVYSIGGFTVFFTILMALRNRPQDIAQYTKYVKLSTWRGRGKVFWGPVGAGIFMLSLPLLAIAGANTLNNGGSNALALGAVGLVAVTMLWLAWTNRLQYQMLYPLGLFSVAATLLLGTSMRGWEITGHDVMQEFQVFQLTAQHSQWSMSFYHDAYTACLSITILPTILQKLSGMYDPYIFKFVFQLFFALIAPLLYSTLRRYVPRKSAFLAAFVFMTFPTFLTDMMMLNRQETAMLLFALAIMTALDDYLSKPKRHILLIIFLGGMVLSHYSTSYVTASVLIGATLLGAALWLLRPLLRKIKVVGLTRGSNFSIFPPYVVVLLLLMVVGWSGLATNTAGNINQTITTISNDVIRMVNPKAAPPKPTVTVSHDNTLSGYIDTVQKARQLAAADYYPDASQAAYVPHEVDQQDAPVTPLLKKAGVPSALLDKIYGMIRTGYVALLTVLLGLGLAVMLLKRNATRLPNQYILLGISCLVVVVLQMVLPSGAIDYGITRLIQQGLVVLALPAVVGIVWLLSKARFTFGARFRLPAVGLVAMFLVLSSWLPALTGGFKPALAFSNSGFYYEAYYTHPEEIAADKWLATNAPKGSRVYADEFARRKMITYAGIFPQPTLVPSAIPVDTYVYLSVGNTKFNEVPVYYNGNLLFYSVPTDFLKTHKNLLYNSGGVMIYK